MQGRSFHFLREIASGGFGSVFLAEVGRPDGGVRRVAVKLLHPKWSDDADVGSRMRDEARMLARLRHPNVVEVHDLTRLGGRAAVVMEYLEGVDLGTLTAWLREAGQRIPLKAALEIAAAVADVLDAAYNAPVGDGGNPLRIIHRDIKPSNIMVDGTGRVKVLDFGTARAEFDARESKTQEVAFGSLEYMPPERLFFEPESSNSDVYSLAATLFELLALEQLGKARLRLPEHEAFAKSRFEDLLVRYPMPFEQVEDVLSELLTSMLSFDAGDRPAAADVASRLRSFARQVSGRPLGHWAEEVLPPLIRRGVRAQEQSAQDPLVGQTVLEDAVGPGLGRSRSRPPEPSAPPPEEDEDAAAWDESPTQHVSLSDLQGSEEEGAYDEDEGEASVAEEGSAAVPRTWLWIGGGAVIVGGLLVAGLALVSIGAGGLWYYAQSAAPPAAPVVAAAPDAAPAPAPEAAPPAPAPVAVEGPAARFQSMLANTKKVQARCSGGQGDGPTEAVVAGEGLGECTVIAVTAARERRTAVVKDVTARAYVCFEGDTSDCR